MAQLCDESGGQAVIGKSWGYWLDDDDFVSTANLGARSLGSLGFPRNWPAVYSESKLLKSLIGKKGRCAGKRVAVVAAPAEEDSRHISSVLFEPLHSFANAERACKAVQGVSVVRGWLVLEHLDMPPGEAFVAERYWWNALPDGKWVDFTPRPKAWQEVILAEAVAGSPKSRSQLSPASAELAVVLLRQRFSIVVNLGRLPSAAPTAAPQKQASPPAKIATKQAPLDYSKWAKIVDSDDEEEAARAAERAAILKQQEEPCGVRDLADLEKTKRRPLPVPDYLMGNSGGGGGTNCFTSICRLLDQDSPGEKPTDNTHQLTQAFWKTFHCGMLDHKRQSFYERALNTVPEDAFVIVCGLGSILPFLRVARRGAASGVLLDVSSKLCLLAENLLKVNNLSLPCHHVAGGMDSEENVEKALRRVIPKGTKKIVVVTEQFAHDMLSCCVVANMFAMHKVARKCAPNAQVNHIPKTIELTVTPLEVRSERLGRFDIRMFNMLRHTTSNDKADFWWWPVRLNNQPNVKVAALGQPQVLCGFDFDRAPEITFDEVRRQIKLSITKRGRCNGAGLWWSMRFGKERYSTEPPFIAKERGDQDAAEDNQPYRPEWKQAVHYLAGETSVFPGDTIELLTSITPRFTVRMMQESPFSASAPAWIKAPTHSKFSATLPVLPYHFLMMTDTVRLEAYQSSIQAAVRQKKKELGRRPRVLDAGCGIGLLGMMAALEGAEVWQCEAVPMMRRMAREVIGANCQDIAANNGMINLLPDMMSTQLQVGPDGDVKDKFDIVVSEVMDLWCLGEGVIPTMRHANAKLLAEGGILIPGRLAIFAQPIELSLFSQPEKINKVNLSPMYTHFTSKYSPLRIQQFPHRFLTDEAMLVLEVDLYNIPEAPREGLPNLTGLNLCIRMGGKPALQAKLSSATLDRSGMLSGYGVWWAADLGAGHLCSSSPSNPQRSWKQLVRWLDEPRFVQEGQEVQVLACHNDNQVNIDDIFMPEEMISQFQAQLRAEQADQPRDPVSAVHAAQARAVSPSIATAPASKPPADEDDIIEVD
jgi:type II protein arginine methyltransferase